MGIYDRTSFTQQAAARAARRGVEDALDGLGRPWPWHLGLSRLIDMWVIAEEAA
jgi:hypothetical protein